ncbi:MAG: rod shape-determining protein MreC [Desulfobacterales bacterium]|nr:rod shape-determining protein MreC [Desulfobacterales bacterium]MDJ0889543.1 rod shape-determining protein MreC [Desulfobacterales bacterium]MDJ0989952.1 rod shape-determining protein MreC [Desulfobacterales bacterium]
MFSRKTVVIIGVVFLVIANFLILAVVGQREPSPAPGGLTITVLAPFQNAFSQSSRFLRDIWRHYFATVAASRENDQLKKQLARAEEMKNVWVEARLANERLRRLIVLEKSLGDSVVFAEVIAKDPTTWFKTVIINKGRRHGVEKGMPALVPEGIVGQVVEASAGYAKILLIVDRNSAVDALVQRNRVRGMLSGASTEQSHLDYVLLKEDVQVGDTIVTSGLDGVFPKGLRIGSVQTVEARPNEMFHTIVVAPFVDFDKLEELLVVVSAAPVPDMQTR